MEEAEEVIGRERSVWERSRVEWCVRRVAELERKVVEGNGSKGKGKGKAKAEDEAEDKGEVEMLRAENERLKRELQAVKAYVSSLIIFCIFCIVTDGIVQYIQTTQLVFHIVIHSHHFTHHPTP